MNNDQLQQIQKATSEYFYSEDWGSCGRNNRELHETVPFDTIQYAFIAGAEWMAGSVPRWVKAKDRLPDTEGVYCIKGFGEHLNTARFKEGEFCDRRHPAIPYDLAGLEWLDESAPQPVTDSVQKPDTEALSFERFQQLAYQVEQDTIDYMVKEVLHPQTVQGRFGNYMSFSEALRSFAGYLLQNIECVAKMPNQGEAPESTASQQAPDQGSTDGLQISSLQAEVSDFINKAEAEAKHRASQHNYTTWQHDAKWFVKGVKWALEQVADTTPDLADKLKKAEACSNARKAEILRLRETADEMAEELEQLRSWKAQALACTPDWQAIGNALNLQLGTSVSDQVLPAILNLLKDRRELVLTLRRLQSYCLHYVKAYEKTGRCREVEAVLDKYHHSTINP